MLQDYELKEMVGGAINATFLSAIFRGVNSILELGRSLGTAIRRLQSGKLC